MHKPISPLQAGYESVAEQYAQEFFDELTRKPFDCAMLDEFAEDLRGKGLVYDLGCGPGHVARYLRDHGVQIRGLDLSAEMVSVAERLSPDILFEQGDMSALQLTDNSLTGVVLFYSIIHIARKNVRSVLHELKRVLCPAGKLLMAFHGGEETVHRDEWYGRPVSIDFRFFREDEMVSCLETAGFGEIRIAQREAYDFEYPTRRYYLSATKPTRV
jgi:ubiquinone/menaquinone biosynthesis C-methylase UbiE